MDFLETVINTFASAATGFLIKIIMAAVVLFAGMKLVNFLVKLISKSYGMKKMDETARGFIITTIKFVLKGIVVVSVVAILGVSTASIIAVIGSCGVAVGLALQGSLSNFAGGLMLLIFKPFEVGDYISTPDASGTVVSIGIFYTTLCTPDNVKVVIPNSNVSGNIISNTSAYDTRRLSFSFMVAHNENVDKVKDLMAGVIASCDKVLKDPAPETIVTAYKENGVEITSRCWVNAGDYWDVNFAINEAVKEKFVEEGINIPAGKIDVNIINK